MSIVKSVVKFVLFDLHFICTVELYPYGPRPQFVSLKKLLTPVNCCLLQDGFTAAEKSGQEPPEERTLQVFFPCFSWFLELLVGITLYHHLDQLFQPGAIDCVTWAQQVLLFQ
jgi:hypothetical protein